MRCLWDTRYNEQYFAVRTVNATLPSENYKYRALVFHHLVIPNFYPFHLKEARHLEQKPGLLADQNNMHYKLFERNDL